MICVSVHACMYECVCGRTHKNVCHVCVMCVCLCVCVCVRACVRACVCVRPHTHTFTNVYVGDEVYMAVCETV